MIKVLDLFSGIGGFSLAAHRAGFEVVAHCEIDAFPRAVLAYRFPTISSAEHAFALGAESRQAVCVAENIIGRQDHNGGNGVGAQEGVSYTLNATGVHGVSTGCGVRRLTPRECERLQAFPDDWTKIPYRGKSAEDCPDSLRYKACGNAITVAVGEYVLRRLRSYIDNNI